MDSVHMSVTHSNCELLSVVVWIIFPKLHIQSRSAMHVQSRLDYIYDPMLCVPKKTRVHYCEWEFPVLIIQSEKWQLLCGSTIDYPAIHTTVWKEIQINLAAQLSIVQFMSLNISKFLFWQGFRKSKSNCTQYLNLADLTLTK